MMLEGLTGITKSSYTGDGLISRQDAIDAIRKFKTYKLFKKNNMLLVDQAEVMTELMMLPSADRPTGEWIKTEHCLNDTGYRRWIEIECPFCGERPTYEFLENMKYCPNCGAKMEVNHDK